MGGKLAVATLADVEQREVECGVGLVLDLVVLDIGARVQDDLGDGVGAVDLAGEAGVGFDDRRRLPGPASTTDRGLDMTRRAAGLGKEHQLDRPLDDHAGGERDERAVLG